MAYFRLGELNKRLRIVDFIIFFTCSNVIISLNKLIGGFHNFIGDNPDLLAKNELYWRKWLVYWRKFVFIGELEIIMNFFQFNNPIISLINHTSPSSSKPPSRSLVESNPIWIH
jgi:hypothetical protein